MKSCYNCVHRVDSRELGLSVCGQKARIVSILGFAKEDSQVPQAMAKECVYYANSDEMPEPQRSTTRESATEVVDYLPSVRFARKGEVVRITHRKVTNCGDCRHFIPAVNSEAVWGINAPVCAALGVVIKPTRVDEQGKACSHSERIESPAATQISLNVKDVDTRVMDEYRVIESSKVEAAVVAAPQGGRHHFAIDPRSWQTERPVTKSDVALGIKAWRRFTDPKGRGGDIFAPILDWQALGLPDPRTTYGKAKPELYVDHSGLLYRMAALTFGSFNPGVGLSMTPALLGEAGTGKTEAFIALAYLLDAPFTRIQFTGESDRFDLEGSLQVRGGETVFQDGVLTAAYERPGVLLLDEPNAAPDSLWFLLRPVLDAMGQFTIASSEATDHTGKKVGGRVVRKHPLAFIGAAMNPPDFKYRGARELSQADWERLAVLRLELPDESVEREIIKLQLDADGIKVKPSSLDSLMGIASEIRALYNEGGIEIPWGVRQNVRVAKLLVAFTLQDAFRVGCTSRLSPETESLIMTIVNKYDRAS